jgi:hypothetical protein
VGSSLVSRDDEPMFFNIGGHVQHQKKNSSLTHVVASHAVELRQLSVGSIEPVQAPAGSSASSLDAEWPAGACTDIKSLMLPTGLPAFALSKAGLAAFAPGARAGAWPAIELRALLQRPLQPAIAGYMRRSLAIRGSALDAGAERVLPRPWWPEEDQRSQPVGQEEAGAAGAVRFLLELASRLDPVAAAARPSEVAGSGGSSSASVAVVLRLSQHGRALAPGLASKISSAIVAQQQRHARAVESLPEPEQQANEILDGYPHDELEGVQVEVLYISRTVVGADGSRDARRWSGQIAFPGGKSQSDETPLETACRESVEEVQLDLTSADFRLIGRLPPRTAKAGLPLNAFVFVHTSGMAQVTPDPFEVASLSPSLPLSLSPHTHTR